MNGLKIYSYKDISIKYQLNIYNKPQKVYIPLISKDKEKITVLVKKDDYIFKGSIIGKIKGKYKTSIFSSVSGKVIAFEEYTIFNGKKVKCVVIENDFKERIEKGLDKTNNLNEFSKKEFIEILKNSGIIGLDETEIPAYVKYDTDKKIYTLIINTIKYSSYVNADCVIIKEKCEEILEVIDAILEINNIDKCIIVINKNNKDLIEILNNYLGTYLNIEIVPVSNLYSKLNEQKLVKKITGINYIEKGIIIDNISTMYAIYQALKQNKPFTEKIVTFILPNVEEPVNLLVKFGTSIKEIIRYLIGKQKIEENIFINDNLVSKYIVNSLVVTPELNSVVIKEKKNKSNKKWWTK